MVKVLDSNNQHVWKCLECGKISKYITNLKGHVEANHFQGLQFNCGLCAKVFKSRGSLRNHISNIHKEKHGLSHFPLVWFIFVLAVFEQIKTFMGTAFDEEGKKLVVCKFCGHKSKYATNIRSHIEGKHTEGLVYKCLYCDYSVNTWQTVLQHMRRTHSYQTSLQQPLNSVHSQM